jgi:fused-like protein
MENYQVLHLIGEGCFGKVFKGRRKYTGQAVALKFISTRGKSEKDLKNLRQEMAILKTLKHENIILLIDAFETASDFVVVTEFAYGELFEIFQDDRQLPESEVQLIAQQLVRALFYLHSNRVIHRDMKPQNILIGSNNVVKLCDFGFARAMSNKTVVLNSVKGTPLYMAPELVQEQPYNHTADLWSLGVILYELFVGTPPFYTNSLYSLINLIINDTVKYPDSMSPVFKSFLQGLLQKNPSKRLEWPALLDHPFVASSGLSLKPSPSPALSTAPVSTVTTPRNSELTRAALRDIQSGFNPRAKYGNEEEIVNECISVLTSGSVSRDVLHVTEFLIQVFQYQGDQFSTGLSNPPVHHLFKLIVDRSIDVLPQILQLIEKGEEGSVSQLLRLFGLWLREGPISISKTDELVLSFLKILMKVLSLQTASESVLVHTCKCLTVLFTNLSGQPNQLERNSGNILRSIVEKLLKLVVRSRDRTARAAMHALSASAVLSAPSGEKDIPSPWSSPSWLPPSSTDFPVPIPVSAINSCAFKQKLLTSVEELLIVQVNDKTTSSPRQQYSVSTLDPAAVQLLYILVVENADLVALSLGFLSPSGEVPTILSTAISGRTDDVITVCQVCGIVGNVVGKSGGKMGQWLTPEYCRHVCNWLSTQTGSPWVFAYVSQLVCEFLKKIDKDGSKRLQEAVGGLASQAQSLSIRFFAEYSKNEDRRRIEAKMTGHLARGPLDGFFELAVSVGTRRLLRGLLGIAGGMRQLIALCGPVGLLSLSDCVCESLTTGSLTPESLQETLSVLQSVVLVVQAGLVDLSSAFPRFNALLDTLVHVITASEDAGAIESLSSGNFVPGLLNAINDPFRPPSRSSLSLLSLLTQTSVQGVQQFVTARGLEVIGSVLKSGPAEEVGESLTLLSNIARAGSQFYAQLHEKVDPYSAFIHLLEKKNTDPNVQSRVCNAIGNMARHSAFFYPHLVGLVRPLGQTCQSSDSGCRKFASFAIGNLAFHSAALYGELRMVIPVLVHLLRDEDEKTRANAAGALGNFVRNSSALVPGMVEHRAVEELLKMASGGPVDSSRRIALFSLGNLAMHAGSREILRAKSGGVIERILANARSSKDSQTVKYCERLMMKLGI